MGKIIQQKGKKGSLKWIQAGKECLSDGIIPS